jgi:hypothetical protein
MYVFLLYFIVWVAVGASALRLVSRVRWPSQFAVVSQIFPPYPRVCLRQTPQTKSLTIFFEQHFYINYRRSLTHCRLNPNFGDYWRKPPSLDAWINSEERSVKLDILAQVVKYHLECDGQCPLLVDSDGQSLAANKEHEADEETYLECDRIVVYGAFPSSNQAILDVSLTDCS